MDQIMLFSMSDRSLLPCLRLEVAMRRFSQQLLQWVFMFGLLALVLTCFVLAGCATMAAGSSCGG